MHARTALSLVAGLTLGLATPRAAAQEVVYSGTLRGELVVTGNTLGLDSDSGTAPGIGGSIGTFIANPITSPTSQEGTYPVGTTADFNSNGSEAELDLPDGASIVKAELVWACSSQSGGLPATPATTPSSVNLRLPNGTQQTVSPQGETTSLTLLSDAYKYYQRWADVTGAVTVGGSGRYMVSRVVGTQFMDINYVTGCGWALFVVYAHPDLPMRNINLWVVGQEVRDDDNANCPCEAEIEVSGFCTPTEEGAALGRMVVTALEGDARFTDDMLMIADPLFPGDFYPLSGPNNAYDNFFSSQINGDDGALDTRGTFGSRNHSIVIDPDDLTSAVTLSIGARQGWDVTTIPLNDDEHNPFVLENGQSATTLLATTGGIDTEGDDYIISAIGLALDFASPDLAANLHQTASDVTWIGDRLDFTVTLVNEGSGAADAVYFCYQASSNTTFVSMSVDGIVDPNITAGQLAPSNCAAAQGGVPVGGFAPGQQRTITLRYQVDSLVAAPSALDKVVGTPSWRLEWAPPCVGAPSELDRQTGVTVEVPGVLLEATLAVAPTGIAVAGDVLTYTLTITNRGSGDSPAGVVARLPIPNGVTYVAGSTTLNGQAVADAAGQMPFVAARQVQSPGEPAGVIAAGDSAVVVFRVRVASESATTISQTGYVDADGAGAQPERPSNTVQTQVEGVPTEDDQDEDGIPDSDDNCVVTWNPLQENNYDQTGYNPAATDEGDACDDTDGDGLLDVEEDPDHDGPEPTQTDATKVDTDGDGLCDGNKQVAPCIGVEDRDGDKDPLDWGLRETNPIDADTDDDGICDGAQAGGACLGGEVTQGTDPLKTDSDGDGLCDGPGGGAWDLSGCKGSEPGPDGVYQAGTDTDPSKSDTDGDGLCDGFDNGASDCQQGEDLDGDRDPGDYNGVDDPETNPLDADTDGGGVDDGTEVLVQRTNPRDRCDGDLVNCEEGDTDQDGIPDSDDNCPFVPNPGQEDFYPPPVGNGIGDACDDQDKDGITDRDEDLGPDGAARTGDETDPLNPDSDGDGLCDGHVIVSPCVGVEDTDGDFDGADRGTTETDPTNPDTDGDGLCDGIGAGGACLGGEQITRTNPLDTDSDGDGLCDGPGGGAWDQSGCRGSETGSDGAYNAGIDTDPANPDTDGDTLCDGFVNGATTCRHGEDFDGDRDVGDFDEPGDSETDPMNPDTDRGGVSDGVEFDAQTNPRDACVGDGQVCADNMVAEGGACSGGAGSLLGLLAGVIVVIGRALRRGARG